MYKHLIIGSSRFSFATTLNDITFFRFTLVTPLWFHIYLLFFAKTLRFPLRSALQKSSYRPSSFSFFRFFIVFFSMIFFVFLAFLYLVAVHLFYHPLSHGFTLVFRFFDLFSAIIDVKCFKIWGFYCCSIW